VSPKNLHEEGLNRLEEEAKLLKQIRHKNIIKIYTSWVDTETNVVNFITEIFNSGTLRECVSALLPPSLRPWRGGYRDDTQRASQRASRRRLGLVGLCGSWNTVAAAS
jgi:serine/threonine protein kinase